ncbi:hypothetical protein ACCP41_004306 [Escherichia coli]|uniref:hypothetical protein n=1 Tax=Escherichia coli TaxID=562 RepID=UPI000BE44B4E|nr:hypothetical protein [Escherichia coli]EFI4641598.1 hypothetical protein [Escherichia coli]EKD2570629.1 hypothetical protein [Escherichia coli]EKG5187699.1 hypothetical protein [Escherichia coli]EKP1647031.1 hypothetical protein [Escherichia coli]MCN3252770.1 hypothetical protein [Escherichia coli]
MKKILLAAIVVSTFSAQAAYLDEAFYCDSIDNLESMVNASQTNDTTTLQSLVINGQCDTLHEKKEIKGIMDPGRGYVVFRFADTDKSAVTLTEFVKDYN